MVLNESIYKSKQDLIHSRSIFQSYIDFDPQIETHIQLLRVTKYSTISTSTTEVGNAFNVRSSKDQVLKNLRKKRGFAGEIATQHPYEVIGYIRAIYSHVEA